MPKQTKKRGPGRPPAGERGQKTSEFPRLSSYLTPEASALLKAWTAVSARPVWQVLSEAIAAGVRTLPASVARRVYIRANVRLRKGRR